MERCLFLSLSVIMEQNQIIIYQTPNGETAIDVKIKNDTVWLTQAQMVKLFERDQSVISRHIKNVFKENELDEKSNMQNMHIANSDKPVNTFNLDVIISVGYRIKSVRGTQFRIWANKILKDYLIKGYTLNEKRLKQQTEQLSNLKNTVSLLSNILQTKELNSDEATGLLQVVTDYAYALDVLDRYDHPSIELRHGSQQKILHLLKRSKKLACREKDCSEKFAHKRKMGG